MLFKQKIGDLSSNFLHELGLWKIIIRPTKIIGNKIQKLRQRAKRPLCNSDFMNKIVGISNADRYPL